MPFKKETTSIHMLNLEDILRIIQKKAVDTNISVVELGDFFLRVKNHYHMSGGNTNPTMFDFNMQSIRFDDQKLPNLDLDGENEILTQDQKRDFICRLADNRTFSERDLEVVLRATLQGYEDILSQVPNHKSLQRRLLDPTTSLGAQYKTTELTLHCLRNAFYLLHFSEKKYSLQNSHLTTATHPNPTGQNNTSSEVELDGLSFTSPPDKKEYNYIFQGLNRVQTELKNFEGTNNTEYDKNIDSITKTLNSVLDLLSNATQTKPSNTQDNTKVHGIEFHGSNHHESPQNQTTTTAGATPTTVAYAKLKEIEYDKLIEEIVVAKRKAVNNLRILSKPKNHSSLNPKTELGPNNNNNNNGSTMATNKKGYIPSCMGNLFFAGTTLAAIVGVTSIIGMYTTDWYFNSIDESDIKIDTSSALALNSNLKSDQKPTKIDLNQENPTTKIAKYLLAEINGTTTKTTPTTTTIETRAYGFTCKSTESKNNNEILSICSEPDRGDSLIKTYSDPKKMEERGLILRLNHPASSTEIITPVNSRKDQILISLPNLETSDKKLASYILIETDNPTEHKASYQELNPKQITTQQIANNVLQTIGVDKVTGQEISCFYSIRSSTKATGKDYSAQETCVTLPKDSSFQNLATFKKKGKKTSASITIHSESSMPFHDGYTNQASINF